MIDDIHIEDFELRLKKVEDKIIDQEAEIWGLVHTLKDLRKMNSLGKTKEIADEIELIMKRHTL